MNENTPTIVTLSPSNNPSVRAVSFEEAFGEHSNLFGKGRARRKKRRLERVKNRGEVRAARRANRQAKVEDKVLRKKTRLSGRMDRKATRKASRQGPDEAPEEEVAEETTSTQETSEDTGGSPQSQGGGESQSLPDDNGMEDVGADLNPDGEEEEGGEEEESEFDGDSNFDGDDDSQFMGEESSSEFANESRQTPQINPRVMALARKIELNSYIIHCLNQKLGKGNDDESINAEIAQRQAELSKLNNMSEAYSNARGGGKAARKEARAAKKVARKELKANRQAARAERKAAKKGIVPVDAELAPEVSESKVEIPAEETTASFNGTGIIAIDEEGDFDAPETREVEIKSNFGGASGKGSKIPWVGIGIGVAAIGLLYFLHKKKVI